jgi:hypothetical protein
MNALICANCISAYPLRPRTSNMLEKLPAPALERQDGMSLTR